MSGSLARRVSAVVAAKTVTRNVDVVEVRWKPPDGRMTIVAVITAGDMRRVFTRRHRSVVAARTGTDDLCVVDPIGWREDNVVVTIFANICGLDMRGVFANRIVAVVAAETVVDYVRVIKCRRDPASRRMAVITSITAAYMCRMLACSGRTIVAG